MSVYNNNKKVIFNCLQQVKVYNNSDNFVKLMI